MFFRLLLIIFLIYIVVNYFKRIFRVDNSGGQKSSGKEKEGKVSVNNPPASSKTINKDEGEYIDFEETK